MVDDRRYEQLKADFKATQRSVTVSFNVEIVRHASTIYTPAVFKMFQSEVSLSYDSSLIISSEIENVTEYKVVPYKKHFQHTVKYDSSNGVVTCSCKKFEFAGILCSHTLKVLSSKNITRIPAIYILKRWTKHAKTGSDRGTCPSSIHNDPKVGMRNRYKDLCGRYTELTTKGATNEETYKIAVNAWSKAMEAIDACFKGGDKETNTHDTSPVSIENIMCSENTNNNVKGIKKKERSRGTSRRPKGILERKRKKRKNNVQEDEPSPQNLACGLPPFQSTELPTYVAYNNPYKESSSNISLTELLRAQLSGVSWQENHQGIDQQDHHP